MRYGIWVLCWIVCGSGLKMIHTFYDFIMQHVATVCMWCVWAHHDYYDYLWIWISNFNVKLAGEPVNYVYS